MPTQKKVRIALDIALTAMIVFEMFIQFTGEFLHEVIGFVFFATVITHLALSAKWMKGTVDVAKTGKLTARRTALAVMGILLAITMVVLGVSSVAISGLLSSAGFVWTLGSYSVWATIHAVSSYVLCALVTVHLAMHWAFLASAFKVPYSPSRRRAISTGVHAVAAVGAVALGVVAIQQVKPSAANTMAIGEESGASEGGRRNRFSDSINDTNGDSTHRRKRDGSGPNSSSNSGSSSNANPPENNSSPNQDSSTATGICTLCRKRCPLSAPQCDRPYEAGLI